MQHFRLKLECGHFDEETAVVEHQGKTYEPDYVKTERACRVCRELKAVVDQRRIGKLMGSYDAEN